MRKSVLLLLILVSLFFFASLGHRAELCHYRKEGEAKLPAEVKEKSTSTESRPSAETPILEDEAFGPWLTARRRRRGARRESSTGVQNPNFSVDLPTKKTQNGGGVSLNQTGPMRFPQSRRQTPTVGSRLQSEDHRHKVSRAFNAPKNSMVDNSGAINDVDVTPSNEKETCLGFNDSNDARGKVAKDKVSCSPRKGAASTSVPGKKVAPPFICLGDNHENTSCGPSNLSLPYANKPNGKSSEGYKPSSISHMGAVQEVSKALQVQSEEEEESDSEEEDVGMDEDYSTDLVVGASIKRTESHLTGQDDDSSMELDQGSSKKGRTSEP
uniref:Uncharacterized protein n=1 Tax=Ananas comosus var. bracteatus TaxID=296719 RepID=A0A6V7QP39_ANACO|nr:unnamed protein product [Ananas comosus var. bracteatus]